MFEHDEFFWDTFLNMSRALKPGGFLYINVPSGGHYHGHPGDAWRFYKDAAKYLSKWAARNDIFIELVFTTLFPQLPIVEDMFHFGDNVMIFYKPHSVDFKLDESLLKLKFQNYSFDIFEMSMNVIYGDYISDDSKLQLAQVDLFKENFGHGRYLNRAFPEDFLSAIRAYMSPPQFRLLARYPQPEGTKKCEAMQLSAKLKPREKVIQYSIALPIYLPLTATLNNISSFVSEWVNIFNAAGIILSTLENEVERILNECI